MSLKNGKRSRTRSPLPRWPSCAEVVQIQRKRRTNSQERTGAGHTPRMSGLVEDIISIFFVIEVKDTVDSDMGLISVPNLYFIFYWGEMSSPNFGLFIFILGVHIVFFAFVVECMLQRMALTWS